ncbi:MAG: serine hydrolase domain-containing protein [Myxococcota bacterium]
MAGTTASGFEHVAEAFEAGAADLGRGGGAFCAYVDGEKVVDLWTGNAAPGRPWQEDTRAVLMSSTKGAAALCCLVLADRGRLDVDRRVADYWPEFAKEGKEHITVRQLLDHSAGTIGVPGHETLLQWDGTGWRDTAEIVRRLERAAPAWEPGTQHGYHALTCGWLWGELLRRITATTLGQFFRDEIAVPLGLELEIGTPVADRVARVIDVELDVLPPDIRELLEPLYVANRDPATLTGQAFLARDGVGLLDRLAQLMNNPSVLAAEVPGGNGTATARGVARMYAALALGGELDGCRICGPDTIAQFTVEQRCEDDVVIGLPVSRGLGYWLNRVPGTLGNRMGPNDEAFGHGGAGGQIGFADPVRRVSVGFVRSQLSLIPTYSDALIEALYAHL